MQAQVDRQDNFYNENNLNLIKPIKLTTEMRHAHVNAFKQCGLTMTAYCKQHNLKISAFSNWNARYSKKKNATFLPVQLRATPALKKSEGEPSLQRLEIHKGDLKIILPLANNVEAMTNLVKMVISCN